MNHARVVERMQNELRMYAQTMIEKQEEYLRACVESCPGCQKRTHIEAMVLIIGRTKLRERNGSGLDGMGDFELKGQRYRIEGSWLALCTDCYAKYAEVLRAREITEEYTNE